MSVKYDKSIYWFKMDAEQGRDESQFNFVAMDEKGKPIDNDLLF